jgi:predicted nuclease of restriction endonuclease-like RecB superfamily
MLYRATRMAVDVFDNYRSVFTQIKLAGLMYSIKPLGAGYRVLIDGPLSLFHRNQRYGVGMSQVLPAVLKCRNWRLIARVNVGSGEKTFKLSPANNLKSHYRDQPEFDSEYERAFFERFTRSKKSKWTIEREAEVIDLKGTIMLPDFRFTHTDGRVAHLEIVGYWTAEYLERKIAKLHEANLPNMIVAAPRSLKCADEEFAGPVIRYKQRLLLKDVMPVLEAVAMHPDYVT